VSQNESQNDSGNWLIPHLIFRVLGFPQFGRYKAKFLN